MNRERDVSRAFVALADTLHDAYDVLDLLDRLVGFSVDLLGVDAATTLLHTPSRGLQVMAASCDDAQLLELHRLQSSEGPCLECFCTAAPVSVTDLAAAGRWPALTQAVARSTAFRSIHAVPMRLRGDAIGTLNLFHRRPGALPAADLSLVQALADVATIGILSERAISRRGLLAEQLQTALDSRVVIEQAKGVLAARSGLPVDGAFDLLRRHARNHNLRLVDLADAVVARDGVATEVLSSPTGDDAVTHYRRRDR